jgi:hypothetical protein
MILRHFLRTQYLLASALALLTAGCLSLGGKTTYVQESPETATRLSSLEARLSALEQALSGAPSPAVPSPIPSFP